MYRLAAITSGLLASAAAAQTTENHADPIGTAAGNAIIVTGKRYAVPDLPPSKPPPPAADHFITVIPSLALLVDSSWFDQDAASISQVGAQPDRLELRAMRFGVRGGLFHGALQYQVAAEYKGFDGDPDTDWQLTDLNVTLPLGERAKLTFGKQKEPFAYEMVGDAVNLQAQERVLNPFFVSRNTGVRFQAVLFPEKRGTFSVGVYNDNIDPGRVGAARGWDMAARTTALLWAPADGRDFLHLGLGWRHVGAQDTLRYRGKPGSNVATNFVDTGNFAADSAEHFGLEAMLGIGGVLVAGEWIRAQVDAPLKGSPDFTGWTVTASWVPTGEARPYDRNVGYVRRVVPKGRWGAPELVARYGLVDLTDAQVDGGRMRRLDLGVNWWATTRWKYGLGWGRVWLDRGGSSGLTDTVLARAQWVY